MRLISEGMKNESPIDLNKFFCLSKVSFMSLLLQASIRSMSFLYLLENQVLRNFCEYSASYVYAQLFAILTFKVPITWKFITFYFKHDNYTASKNSTVKLKRE